VANLSKLGDRFVLVRARQSQLDHSFDDQRPPARPIRTFQTSQHGGPIRFRSLAGELRRTGGFAKDTTPFSEFLWSGCSCAADQAQGGRGRFRPPIEKALQLAAPGRQLPAGLVRPLAGGMSGRRTIRRSLNQ